MQGILLIKAENELEALNAAKTIANSVGIFMAGGKAVLKNNPQGNHSSKKPDPANNVIQFPCNKESGAS